MQMPYRFMTAAQLIGGPNAVEDLGGHLPALGPLSSVLILTQPSIVRLGYLERITVQLDRMNVAWHTCDRMAREPTLSSIYDLCADLGSGSFDAIIGIGGGSVLDAAKLVSILLVDPMAPEQLLQPGSIKRKGIPTVLIPTTSGTGSEVTPNAIVTLPEEQLKVGIISPCLYPELVILDPALTLELPKDITASTGMDAYTHALESFISNKANPISNMFALEAIRLLSSSLLHAYEDGHSLIHRERMLLGSTYAGMALASSGTAAVHALAYPLGGSFNVPHGVANSMLLAHVMAFNMDAIADRLLPVAEAMGYDRVLHKGEAPAEWVVSRISEWTAAMNIPQNLHEFGAGSEDIERLSVAASKVTRLLNNNPKPLELSDIAAIYRRLLPSSYEGE